MGGVSTEYEMACSSYSCYVSSSPFSTNWLPLLPSLALPSFASLLFLFPKFLFQCFYIKIVRWFTMYVNCVFFEFAYLPTNQVSLPTLTRLPFLPTIPFTPPPLSHRPEVTSLLGARCTATHRVGGLIAQQKIYGTIERNKIFASFKFHLSSKIFSE